MGLVSLRRVQMGDLDLELKRLLLAEIKKSKLKRREIEEKLGVTQTAVARILSLKYASRLATLERAANLVGKRIKFILEDI